MGEKACGGLHYHPTEGSHGSVYGQAGRDETRRLDHLEGPLVQG